MLRNSFQSVTLSMDMSNRVVYGSQMPPQVLRLIRIKHTVLCR